MWNLRGHFGELGWGWRLTIGTLVVIGVSRLGCMGVKGMATDYAQFTNTTTPRSVIHNTRDLVHEATGENDDNADAGAQITNLQTQLRDEQVAHRTDLARAVAAEQSSAQCALRITQIEQERPTEAVCAQRVASYFNTYCTCANARATVNMH